MSVHGLLDGLDGFDLLARNHAEAILSVDFPAETAELIAAVRSFAIPLAELVGSGGGEAPSTQRLRRTLAEQGWLKHKFELKLTVDGAVKEAITHEIDHVRRGGHGVLALEIEWNNKDPFAAAVGPAFPLADRVEARMLAHHRLRHDAWRAVLVRPVPYPRQPAHARQDRRHGRGSRRVQCAARQRGDVGPASQPG
ncbi:MAG: BglII/BstYI family type II restriction endonuclease [Amaricoccus sp.]